MVTQPVCKTVYISQDRRRQHYQSFPDKVTVRSWKTQISCTGLDYAEAASGDSVVLFCVEPTLSSNTSILYWKSVISSGIQLNSKSLDQSPSGGWKQFLQNLQCKIIKYIYWKIQVCRENWKIWIHTVDQKICLCTQSLDSKESSLVFSPKHLCTQQTLLSQQGTSHRLMSKPVSEGWVRVNR